MILSNQVECAKCGDRPYSANRHDFKYCKCGAVAVDGGMDYLRRVGDFVNAKEISIEIPDKAAAAACAAIQQALDTKRNTLGILCAVVIALRDNGVDINGDGGV